MKYEFKLSDEDKDVVFDLEGVTAILKIIDKEMLPGFVFCYKKLHPESNDLFEELKDLFKNVRYVEKDDFYGLLSGYKDCPWVYYSLLCGFDFPDKKMDEEFFKINRYICENHPEELVSDFIRKFEAVSETVPKETSETALSDEKIIYTDGKPYKVWFEDEEEMIIRPLKEESGIEPQKMSLIRSLFRRVNPDSYYFTKPVLSLILNELWKTERNRDLFKKIISDPEFGCIENIENVDEEERVFSIKDFADMSNANIGNEIEQFINGENRIKSNNRIRFEGFDKKDDEITDLHRQLSILLDSGTPKDMEAAWDIVTCESKNMNNSRFGDFAIKKAMMNNYKYILKNYGERIPLKLLGKEIENRNWYCILAIVQSGYEKAIRFLFAILWNKIVIEKDYSFLEIRHDFIEKINSSLYIPIFDESMSPINLYKTYIHAIIYSKDNYEWLYDNNPHVGEIFSNGKLEQVSYNNSDRRLPIEHGFSSPDENVFDFIYEMPSKDNFLSESLKYIAEDNPFYYNILEDYKNKKSNPWYDRRGGYYFAVRLIYAFLKSWSEKGTIEHEFINEYIEIKDDKFFHPADVKARIILNAKYVPPEYNEECEEILELLLKCQAEFNEYNEKKTDECHPRLDYIRLPYHIDKKNVWKDFWRYVVIPMQIEIYNKHPVKPSPTPISLPIHPKYQKYILSRSDDIFTTGIDTMMVHEFKDYILKQREKNINTLKDKGVFNDEEKEKLFNLVKKADYYGLSDEEIKGCLSEERSNDSLQKIQTGLESDLMAHIFEKCLLWVVKFDKSELWEGAPWWGMKIFSKSFADRPTVWAKHLLKVLNGGLDKNIELSLVCRAFGDLRVPLYGKTPGILVKITNTQEMEHISKQSKRFNRGNRKKGQHERESKRVEKCREVLLRISQKRFSGS